MASVNREILFPYMDMYNYYLYTQMHGENDRRMSNSVEDYKRNIAKKAAEILDAESWLESDIGKGTIGDRVIKAVLNHVNLVGRFQITKFSDKIKEDYAVSEQILYDLYHDRKDQNCFESICKRFGRNYDLVSYLYFILDPNKYVPLRSSIFDAIFKKLGIDLRTSGRCSWNNYQEYLTTIAAVRDELKAFFNTDDVDLLDSHSFLWTLNPEGVNLQPAIENTAASLEGPADEKKVKVGASVFHKNYGKGTISRIIEENIYVSFDCGSRIFPYPEAIEKEWLTL